MKTLTLLRHAKSGWDDAGRARFRPAAQRARPRGGAGDGPRDAARSASAFDRVLASPAARVDRDARPSWREGYGGAVAADCDERIYLASAETLLDIVRAADDAHERLLIVGHNPGMEQLALLLAAGRRAARRGRGQISDRRARRDRASTADRWRDVGRRRRHARRASSARATSIRSSARTTEPRTAALRRRKRRLEFGEPRVDRGLLLGAEPAFEHAEAIAALVDLEHAEPARRAHFGDVERHAEPRAPRRHWRRG